MTVEVPNIHDTFPVIQARQIPRANSPGQCSPGQCSPGQCQGMIESYHAISGDQVPRGEWFDETDAKLPDGYLPWWDTLVRTPLQGVSDPIFINIAELNYSALQNSSYVKAIASTPQILQSELVKEQAAFDWRMYLNSSFDDKNEPIGSLLTTGNADDRFRDETWSMEGGFRRRNRRGGDVEVFQRFGTQINNSTFLDPNPQRTSRLELRYTQPLMRGAGRAYNQSQIVVAQIQQGVAGDDLADKLQQHLVEVTETYWELYRARADFLQRANLLHSAESILEKLSSRQGVDALRRQVFRVETAVAQRRNEMITSANSIRDLESRLRLLVNDVQLVHSSGREFTPVDTPVIEKLHLDLSESLHTALSNRPDISQAIRNVKAKAVELGVAKSDVMPRLDLLASGYVAGIASRADFGGGLDNQFSDGRPSFSLGLEYELPIGNRFANANLRARKLEMNRELDRFHFVVQQAMTDVEIAVRQTHTQYRRIVAHYESLQAARREAAYLLDRWEFLAGRDDSASQLLENLLDAQTFVADEERQMVRAQVDYALSLVQLKGELGVLLQINAGESVYHQ